MIYPIVIYGHQVLRNETVDIDKNYPELDKLIEDTLIYMPVLFFTMIIFVR